MEQDNGSSAFHFWACARSDSWLDRLSAFSIGRHDLSIRIKRKRRCWL